MKECNVCGAAKPLDEFHNNRSFPDGKARSCKPCNNAYKRRWRAEYPDKNRNSKRSGRRAYERRKRFRKYGITPCEYAAMRIRQNDECAICHQAGNLKIDHDHLTGVVRGLLCLNCNTGIGQLRDSVELLHSAIGYLSR